MAPPDVQTVVEVSRLRVMKVDEYVDEWADLEVTKKPVPKPTGKQVMSRFQLSASSSTTYHFRTGSECGTITCCMRQGAQDCSCSS